MEVTLLGTGSPVPNLDRAGTAYTVSVDGTTYMIDCGPRAVYELMENGIDPASITDLLFTHHHVDHNAAFPHFAIAGWTSGRESLTVYGPDGTDNLLEALYTVYEDDIAYRKEVGYSGEGIEDIDCVRVDAGFELERDDLTVTAMPVDHSIETYAYRFEHDDCAVVFSGDTQPLDRLGEFASGADVLVHDAHLAPVGEPPGDGFVWERYTTAYSEQLKDGLQKTHSTPEQAGEVAAAAGVEALVLTHFPPYRDEAEVRGAAAAEFDGTVHVGRDGLALSIEKSAVRHRANV
ncbi:MBL fold metallo-hydrolase [Halobacterium noricense]|uniref:MBL fold metallo-hydrolase n=1 Tax=Halobacterium noricense TaxID=223182 RepID=UPI001E62D6BE|nr:MBL fold metallo-hydrolase [Halobacterium noricense]UHH24788.1 MBL fold metallo-hydrolase [Halobacterium noricense]